MWTPGTEALQKANYTECFSLFMNSATSARSAAGIFSDLCFYFALEENKSNYGFFFVSEIFWVQSKKKNCCIAQRHQNVSSWAESCTASPRE